MLPRRRTWFHAHASHGRIEFNTAVFWGLSWFTIVKGWHFVESAILTLFSVAAVK